MFQFKSKLVGFNRAGELYDPLIHGETVGTIVGSASFVPGKGLRLNNGQSYVSYLLPSTVTAGEFSMDVEGLAPTVPVTRPRSSACRKGRTTSSSTATAWISSIAASTGFPPNAITFRAIYGDGDDLDMRYEPDTATRMRSVFLAESRGHLLLEGHLGQRVPRDRQGRRTEPDGDQRL